MVEDTSIQYRMWESVNAWKLKNGQLIGYIKTAIGADYFDEDHYAQKSATKLWSALKQSFIKRDGSISNSLSAAIHKVTLGEDSIKAYASKIRKMANRIEATSPDGAQSEIPDSLLLS